ncbi:hypothetical protein BDR03DRAFT_958899 [Suillus americanus]|nr:hypothetical protein BDR03DRAFT_958899 [Suillus americanus]
MPEENGFPSHTLVVVAGHSFGGCSAHAFQLVIFHEFSGLGLKTPPIHEALILSNLGASRETQWELMERLDEDIELL